LLRAVEIRGQLIQYLRRFQIPIVSCNGDMDKIRRCVVAGYFSNAAKYNMADGAYRTVRGNHPLALHPSSVLYTEAPPR
jgi:HrpA-like RNA helicase